MQSRKNKLVTDDEEGMAAPPGNGNSEAKSRRAALTGALIATGLKDRNAFRLVYDMTSAKLFSICLRICEDRQAAEDVLQEVYLIIWRRAPSFEALRSSPITWMATIARNRAVDWRRAHVRKPAEGDRLAPAAVEIELVDGSPAADTAMILDEDAQRLHFCLMALDERPRRAIRAAFLEGLTYSELAQSHGVPLATMKSTVRRGLLQLRKCLSNDA